MRGFPMELSTITGSLKVAVTVMLSFNPCQPLVVEEETEETVGPVVSTVNELTNKVLL